MFRLVLSACLCLFVATSAPAGDERLSKALQLLWDAARIPTEGHRAYGLKFDELVLEYYDHMADMGEATRLDLTFAGQTSRLDAKLTRIYRIGTKEVWLGKRTPVTGHSIDIIVWDLEFDEDGDVVKARGIGMDHHTYHPFSERAPRSAIEHWNSKLTTADFWENILNQDGIDAAIEMDPNNSFYWKDAALDADDFTLEHSRRAEQAMAKRMGASVFIPTTAKILGTSAGALSIALDGKELLDAIEKFYYSPVVARTLGYLQDGDYRLAKRYWEEKCVNYQTSVEACDELRHVLAEKSSLLSVAVFEAFEPFARLLYSEWEMAARAANGDDAASPLGVWKSSEAEIAFVGFDGYVAHYDEDNGRIIGQIEDQVLTGIWVEDEWNSECSEERDGSEFWGQVRLEFNAEFDAFEGHWSYCEDPVEGGTGWTGER